MAALRWARAALLAAVACTTGTIAHVGAGGLLPGAEALIALYLVLVIGCAASLVARASGRRVVVLLVGGQTFIHLALTALAGHGGHAAHTEHLQAGASVRLMDEAHELAGPGAPMALAHVGAAALIGLWLAYGEAALFAVLALTVATIRQLLLVDRPTLMSPPLDPSTPDLPVRRLHARPAGRALCRRGPPVELLTTA